jgi:hypothetical protein
MSDTQKNTGGAPAQDRDADAEITRRVEATAETATYPLGDWGVFADFWVDWVRSLPVHLATHIAGNPYHLIYPVCDFDLHVDATKTTGGKTRGEIEHLLWCRLRRAPADAAPTPTPTAKGRRQ